MSQTDLRGYVNPYVPGGLTIEGQREGMTGEVYIEDRKGLQIDALIRSIRRGSVVQVRELFYLAPGNFRPQKRRRLLAERVEGIQAGGGDIIELATGYRAYRRLPTMMTRAHEQIATSGRARVHNRPGRQIKWNLTREQRELAEGLWRSRRYVNDWDRTVAIQQRLKLKISRGWLRRVFGSPHESK